MSIKKEQEEHWKSKGSIFPHYWNHRSLIRRTKWFIRSILSKYKFSSIYEVGCNRGRNLWFVQKSFPDVRLGGLDIAVEPIEFAKEKIPEAELEVKSIYDLDTEDKFDIVFTSGVLLHIPPEDVKAVIQSFLDKASKYVLHMETQGPDRVINGPAHLNPTKAVKARLRCVHDYRCIYKELGYEAKVYPIPGCNEEDARHIIIVEV